MKYLYAEMTWPEIQEAAAARRVVLLPVCAIEQHGYHLPVDTDNLIATSMCVEAARSRPELLLLLPTIEFGFNEHNMDFPGTIAIGAEALIGMLCDIGRSLREQGFDRLIFVNGHGSNVPFVDIATRVLTAEASMAVGYVLSWALDLDQLAKDRESDMGGMSHAGEYETSLYLYHRQGLVERDKIVDEPKRPISSWFPGDIAQKDSQQAALIDHLSRVSASGVQGVPSLASPEKGQVWFQCSVTRLIEVAEQFRSLTWP